MKNLMRPDLKDDYNILRLQNCILSIAEYLDTFCNQYGIEYCLMGGSALGAVRHKGFIPWDDDLDVFMRPKEYDSFRKKFNECGDTERYYLQEWGACDGMLSFAKLRLNKSTLLERDLASFEVHQGVYVDIFILHACPDNICKRWNQYLWAKYLVAKGAANRGYSKSGLAGFVIDALKMLPVRFLLKYALKQVYRYDNEESRFLCHFMGRAGIKTGLYKRAYFRSNKRVPFETIELNVPSEVEKYLLDRWGDYMKIPPFEDTLKYHHSWKWSENDYFPCFRQDGKYKDEKILLA